MKESEPKFAVRLPKGWDSKLAAIDQQIAQRNAQMDSIESEMNAEIERIKESYLNGIRQINPVNLRGSQDEAWQKIRDQYPIAPPRMVREFKSDRQAAEVLIHYWQGEEIDHEHLWKSVAGFGDHKLYVKAYDFARNLTQPSSPERAYVEKARAYLWKDYSR